MKSRFVIFFFTLVVFLASCKKEPLFDPSKSNIPDQNNFDELERATLKGVSLIYFYNSWDKNSADLLPKLESVAQKPEFDSVYFAKVDFDKNQNIARYYVVRGFPVVILLKDGVEKIRYESSDHSQEKIEKGLKSLL
ncbi:MAG: thioredoxin family protein [Bacteroidia bacterium]|nr:thioredoxin family protein [Bacteroidia bacterium]MCO5254078.1 thioredoxin family protein [Bacteroidota bacterium]MCZ2131453.1 thioredoxin family protein [Bacteroidia bacterium]